MRSFVTNGYNYQNTMAGVEENTVSTEALDKEVHQLKIKYKDICKLFNGTGAWKHIVVLNNPEVGLRIKWRIPGTYPEVTPTIEVTCAQHKDEVQSYIQTQATSMIGQQYMIDKVWRRVLQWIKQTGFKLKGNEHTENAVCKNSNTKQKPREGKGASSDQGDHVEKKSSMKTAEDVISRVMWDKDLDEELFTIGYLDRFIGIVEKNFDAFSWEDLASVDDYDVLAIPQHRIQYFKYNGEIVWDKTTRLDNVFGSTGGVTIAEIASKYKCTTVDCVLNDPKNNIDTVNSASDDCSGVSKSDSDIANVSCGSTSRIDDDSKISSPRMNEITPTDTEVNNNAQDDISLVSGAHATRGNTQKDTWEEDKDNFWNSRENLSDDEDSEEDETNTGFQGLTKREQYWGKKVRPTHFLCIRITNPDTLARIQEIQNTIVDIEPRYASCAIPPCSLHTTIACLGLDNEEQVSHAVKTLQNIRQELLDTKPKNIKLSLKDTGVFTGATLYAKIENNPDYIEFVETLQTKLIEAGVEIRDIFDYTPHTTILKYSRQLQREHRTRYLDTRVCTMFESVQFGEQIVDNVYLCTKNEEKQENGFYVSPCNITFT